jgi:sodium/hydrogen antiporter
VVDVENLNLALLLIGGGILLLDAFSLALQRISIPAPLAALAYGVVLGPFALDIVSLESFGVESAVLLEEAARLTLAVSLTGVALLLPHGYWRQNTRWLVAILGLGMASMWAISAGVIWALTGVPFMLALVVGAAITPTDPVVSTPIVTGQIAEKNIPDRVRFNISAESGVNDGLAFLFVFLPMLLLTQSTGEAWQEWVVEGVVRQMLGGFVLGAIAGYLSGRLFRWAMSRNLMEESAYGGFVVAMAILLVGMFELLGVNAILGVFIASAVFGQVISQEDEEEEDRDSEIISRFFIIPVFILLGMALPFDAWADLGPWVPVALFLALMLRRMVTVWLVRPIYAALHTKAETWFLGWFAAVGISALYYALLVERETGRSDVFPYVTLVITLSLLVHGLTATPFGAWLRRKEQGA